jgi:hypothetical protein
MKSLLFVLIVSVGWYPTYESNKTDTQETIAPNNIIFPDTSFFKLKIQPILVSHCMPCHFTGGKMYEKMPFDNPATILKPEFKNGLLRRIKEEKENALIRQFIEENKQQAALKKP